MIFEEDLIVDDRVNIKPNRFKQVVNAIKNILSYKMIPYIIVLVLTSNVTILGTKPFGIVMLAVATIFNIPLMLPLVVTALSYLIFRQNIGMYINYGVIYILYTIVTSIIEIEGYSKKYVTMIKLALASAVGNLIAFLIFSGTGYKVTDAILNTLISMAFYPVFTSGMSMLLNITKNIVFSKEEIISMCIVLATVTVPLNELNVYGFSIVNVLLMALIMVVAWKNDWLVGTAAGVLIGLIYSIATNQSTIVITAFAFSGLMAGILSRYSKWVVAGAFVALNIGLSAIYKQDVLAWSKLAELIISSAIILVMPKKLLLKLEDIFGTNSNSLGRGYENLLGAGSDINERLSAMSEVFDNLAYITTESNEETVEETSSVIKKYLEDYKKNECISCTNKLNCLNDELDMVSKHIATRLESNKIITPEMIPVNCNLKQELIDDICDIYNNIKLMRLVKQKESESNKKIIEEYKTISGLIKNIAKDNTGIIKSDTPEQKLIREELKYMGYVVYEDSLNKDESDITYEFITDILVNIDKAKQEIQTIVSDILKTEMRIKLVLNSSKTERSRIKLVPSSRYVVKALVKQVRKADSMVSGDSYIVTELKDNSKVIAISDGMGSGPKSKEVSETVVSMISKMSAGGFNRTEIINIINKLIKLKEAGDISATLDMCALNEKANQLEFIKLGAAPSYIINGENISEVKQDTMPMGLLANLEYSKIEKEINKGDYIILISDGAMSDVNKESLQQILDKLKDNSEITEKMLMDEIMNRVVGNQNKIILDDITVVVCKIA